MHNHNSINCLTGLRFLQEDLHIPSVEDDNSVQPFFKQYREIMIEGNTLYSIINPPSHNPNLLVQDVIRSIDFPLVETPFVAVNNHTSFAAIVGDGGCFFLCVFFCKI